MANKKELTHNNEFINIDSYVSKRRRANFFSERSIITFVSVLTFAGILALLIVCLIKYFI